MPQYIAKRVARTKDGSALGGDVAMVTGTDEADARQKAANQFGCSPAEVIATRHIDQRWEALKRGQ